MESLHARASRRLWLLLSFLALVLAVSAQGAPERADAYRFVALEVDTLPNLNTPRSGHATLCLGGELTVLGGHTDGFVPTATAEYFRNGAWHTVPLVYPHDHGIALELRSGKVFLAGGHKEPLGIGQLFSAEMYDPATHTSQGFGCMDRKRAYANAIEMADGQVVISGNWFDDDCIEQFADIYEPLTPNAVGLKDTSVPRSTPYILRIADDDAIVFSSLDNKAVPVDCGIVDRLKGPSYREPFLDTWHPIQTINIRRSTNHFIGNEAEGRYQWLLPVEREDTREVALARVDGPTDGATEATFTLLPTMQALPDSIYGKHIVYSSLICDRERGMAYLIGDDGEARILVVAVPYDTPDTEPFTVYVTEPQPIIARGISPVLTPDGDIIFAGGHLVNNFSPTNSVIRLPLGNVTGHIAADASAAASGKSPLWVWILIPCLLACAVATAIIAMRRRRGPGKVQPDEALEESALDKNLPKDEILSDLFKRIERLMEEERLYLNANLRASDVAARVGSNTAYVSAAINSQRGCSFSQFLATYRISYAQELMRQNPESKISTISALSGFSTDSTFFRAFRACTGMSPKEWLSAIR